MIPILFESTATDFTTNGLGRLTEATSCVVTEERNGSYELEMEYPITGRKFEDLALSRIIYATPSDGVNKQAFRIYKITKPLNGIVTVCAEHISYQLSHIPVMPFDASSAAGALSQLDTNSVETNPFTFWTDRVSEGNFTFDTPTSCRSLLGGIDGSILDTFGGEYEFDNFVVKLHNNRGSDNGVTLRYGKNITSIEQEESIANTVTGVVPYYKSEDALITLTERVVYADNADAYPFRRTIVKDFSSDFETAPTEEQLRSKAQSYIKTTGLGIPSVSLTVEFQPLWQTEEYKDIAALERVRMCDTVTVLFDRLGVSASAKVVSTTYDVLRDRYQKIELGEARSSLSSTISGQSQSISYVQSNSFMELAVKRVSEAIKFGENGYVIFEKDGNGAITEILIMDTDDKETAQKVWRWNLNGLGYSSTGYNGTFETAITMSGEIVANFITSGTMQCSILKGGTLTLGGSGNGSGIASIRNASGSEIVKLDKDGLLMKNGSINVGGKFIVTTDGAMTATGATVSGTITASAGKIAAFTIGTSGIYSNNKSALGNENTGVYLGSEGIACGATENGTSMFEVDSAGTAVMRKAYVVGTGLMFEPGGGIATDYSSHAQLQVLSNGGDVMVNAVNGNLFLGAYDTSEIHCGTTLYNSSSSACKSDKRLKDDIKNLDQTKAHDFVMALKPASFKYKDGTSGRNHHGFIAQDVKEAMDGDWGVFVEFNHYTDPESEPERRYALRYEELIADMVATMQQMDERIKQLEEKLNEN